MKNQGFWGFLVSLFPLQKIDRIEYIILVYSYNICNENFKEYFLRIITHEQTRQNIEKLSCQNSDKSTLPNIEEACNAEKCIEPETSPFVLMIDVLCISCQPYDPQNKKRFNLSPVTQFLDHLRCN